MDNLSNLLSLVRVDKALWSVVRLTEGAGLSRCGDRHVRCYLVLRGPVFLTSEARQFSAQEICLRDGDILLCSGSSRYMLAGCEDPEQIESESLEDLGNDTVPWLRVGNGEPKVQMIVGLFDTNFLSLRALRRLVSDFVIIRSTTGQLPEWCNVLGDARSLGVSLALPGGAALSNLMAELCLVQIIRSRNSQDVDKVQTSSDWRIVKSIRLMEMAECRNWSIEKIAAAVGLSRPAFSSIFQSVIGETPSNYFTKLKMDYAAQMLRNKDLALVEIANEIGYSSEMSLMRIFKKCYGETPTQFRRRQAEVSGTCTENLPYLYSPFVFN